MSDETTRKVVIVGNDFCPEGSAMAHVVEKVIRDAVDDQFPVWLTDGEGVAETARKLIRENAYCYNMMIFASLTHPHIDVPVDVSGAAGYCAIDLHDFTEASSKSEVVSVLLENLQDDDILYIIGYDVPVVEVAADVSICVWNTNGKILKYRKAGGEWTSVKPA